MTRPSSMKAKFRERPYMDHNLVVLEDLNGPKSITNDAEAVVADVVYRHGWYAKRILYRDTIGYVAELVHEEGVFIRFAPIDDDMLKFVKDNVQVTQITAITNKIDFTPELVIEVIMPRDYVNQILTENNPTKQKDNAMELGFALIENLKTLKVPDETY